MHAPSIVSTCSLTYLGITDDIKIVTENRARLLREKLLPVDKTMCILNMHNKEKTNYQVPVSHFVHEMGIEIVPLS